MKIIIAIADLFIYAGNMILLLQTYAYTKERVLLNRTKFYYNTIKIGYLIHCNLY